MEWLNKLRAVSAAKKALKEITKTAIQSVSNEEKHSLARVALSKVLKNPKWTPERLDRLIHCFCDIYNIYFKKDGK